MYYRKAGIADYGETVFLERNKRTIPRCQHPFVQLHVYGLVREVSQWQFRLERRT